MMDLPEKIDKMPASKAMKFIELFFQAQAAIATRATKPTRARYDEADYVKLLSKKMSDDQLMVEINKMIAGTSYAVLRVVMEKTAEMSKLTKVMNNENVS